MSGAELAVPFLGGLAGSLHCIGMCGGFPLALAAVGAPRPVLRQALYNLGRLNTLAFLGAVSGLLGAAVVASGPPQLFERGLAVAAGLLMIAIGLEMLGLLAGVTARGAALVQATLGRWLGDAMRSRSLLAPLVLGVFNAFLPCQLIYAFAARAAAEASAARGMATMLAFGLGTVPAMLALGGSSRILARPALRAHLALASGLLVIGFGAVTLLRGLVGAAGTGHLHTH